MKNLFLKSLSFLFLLGLIYSCSDLLIDDKSNEELELKSANSAKTSYIVVLDDADLNDELSKLKGYEKKQQAVSAVSAKILNRAGIADGVVEHVYGTAIQGFSVRIAPGQLKKLQDDPSVKYIEEDQIITLSLPDVSIKVKPTKPAPTPAPEVKPWGITRVNGGLSGVGKTAWIIDTGIDLDHPDLDVDVTNSESFLITTTSPDDQHGHGTHVAGTIAAVDNEIGVIGVAAGATVVAVRVLDRRGSGSTSGVIAGVNYVAGKASSGDVANMSLGGGVSDALDASVVAASSSCRFTLAAGNESDDANNHSPARVNGPNIYTISAMDSNDNWAYFSNYGNPPIDYCEPGVSIYSCYKGGGYATMSGTSMAAPHMAGLLLLGSIDSGGTVNGDPDGNPDVIGVH